jgi:methionyl-tRNA formyltransferase
VHRLADQLGLPVRTPGTLKTDEQAGAFKALDLDAAVVVAYGHILTKPFLEGPVLGCINIHGSLLPRWRGAAPIHRAILAGDSETGVTTMRMDEGLDTGPMLLAERTPISAADTAETVHDRLAAMGATLIVSTLDGLVRRSIDPTPQSSEGVTYAHKLGKARGRARLAAAGQVELERRCGPFDPWPGHCRSRCNGEQSSRCGPQALAAGRRQRLARSGRRAATAFRSSPGGRSAACGS